MAMRGAVLILAIFVQSAVGPASAEAVLQVDQPRVDPVVDDREHVEFERPRLRLNDEQRLRRLNERGDPATGDPTTGDPEFVDFDSQIVPLLTRSGCNAGACHGSAEGRGEFRLSLWGSDPQADWSAIVQQFKGRRVNLAQPDDSLLLIKPTEQLEHGGGTRFALDSDEVRLLSRWIAQGAARHGPRAAVQFDVEPRQVRLLRPGERSALRATARFDDGSTADVTRWVTWSAEREGDLEIDRDTAEVAVVQRGRYILVARFMNHVVPVELLVPLADQPYEGAYPRSNWIDDFINERLATMHIAPAVPADDATFLRRATLDLTGRLPEPQHVVEFITDSSADRRERLVDRLLDDPSMGDFWTFRLAQWFEAVRPSNDSAGVQAYTDWLRGELSGGTGLDAIATSMIRARGDTHRNGPANFYRSTADPRSQVELFGRAMLGTRLRCASCHNHPLDRWTEDDYHGLAAVFATVRQGRVVEDYARGRVMHPGTGELAQPNLPQMSSNAPLIGERDSSSQPLAKPSDQSGVDQPPTDALADWLVRSDNRLFARNIVNRVWHSMMGRGLVDPVDDLRATNPASHPELFERLTDDFIAGGYDLRRTIRLIATSAAYGRDYSRPPATGQNQPQIRDAPEGEPEVAETIDAAGSNAGVNDRFWARYVARPLEPELLLDAICEVTAAPPEWRAAGDVRRAVERFEPRDRAGELRVLGQCESVAECAADSPAELTLAAQLHLISGPLINARLVDPHGRLIAMIDGGHTHDEIMDELYLRALGRWPTEAERQFWEAELNSVPAEDERLSVLVDLVWALLASWEFRMQR